MLLEKNEAWVHFIFRKKLICLVRSVYIILLGVGKIRFLISPFFHRRISKMPLVKIGMGAFPYFRSGFYFLKESLHNTNIFVRGG